MSDRKEELQELIAAVSNEKSTSTLLEYKETLLQNFRELVEKQSKQIAQELKSITPDDRAASIKRKICQAQDLETLRIKYLIRSYYQTRFEKIQFLVLHGIKPTPEKLSDTELQFVENLIAAMQKNQGPADLQFIDENEAELDNGFAFFQANEDIGAQQVSSIESTESLVVKKNDIVFAHYDQVKHLFDDGKISFV